MDKIELKKRLKALGDECLKMYIDGFVEKYDVPREELEDFLRLAKVVTRNEPTYYER